MMLCPCEYHDSWGHGFQIRGFPLAGQKKQLSQSIKIPSIIWTPLKPLRSIKMHQNPSESMKIHQNLSNWEGAFRRRPFGFSMWLILMDHDGLCHGLILMASNGWWWIMMNLMDWLWWILMNLNDCIVFLWPASGNHPYPKLAKERNPGKKPRSKSLLVLLGRTSRILSLWQMRIVT